MKCSHCEKEMPEEATLCPHCGAALTNGQLSSGPEQESVSAKQRTQLDTADELVDKSSRDSFPASDPPSWATGRDAHEPDDPVDSG